MQGLTAQPSDTSSEATAPEDMVEDAPKTKGNPELATWVMSKVDRWRISRNNNYGTDWEKYLRIFRGKWDPSLKAKQAERSRIITPATQSAVDQTVAEMTDAVFSRGEWFDLSDPPPPQPVQQQAPPQPGMPAPPPPPDWATIEEQVRDRLIDDFENSKFTDNVVETFYNGACYGTGIAKRVVETRLDGSRYICWDPVNPNGFVIDTAAKTIDQALGVAHETIRPLHEIKEKQENGEYYDEDVGTAAAGFGSSDLMKGGLTDFLEVDPQDGVYITEWHGKVPTRLLDPKEAPEDADLMADGQEEPEVAGEDDDKYTEAVVVIGNGTHVLKAERNELKDRGFAAYQHHRNPDAFWGIGVVEKAYNSQVALDAEVRARMDALSLTTYPIVGVDATRMPRNLNMVVSPGKVYMTNGQPDQIIQPISFGNLNNASFQQSGDLERFVQVATGATDPAKPVNGNTTASGQSQQSSAFIKRSKLTMQSVDGFLSEVIRKSIIAYNALNPQRYPKIPQFTVNSTMSIMAREFEQMQMTNLLAIIPQQSSAFPIVLKAIITNYSGPAKDAIIAAIDKSMQPDPQQQQIAQQTQQIQTQTAQAALNKILAEVDEVKSRAGLNQVKGQTEQVKAKLAPVQAQIQAMQANTGQKTADTQARQVEVDAAKVQIDHHHKTTDHLHKKVGNLIALQKAQQPAQAPAAAE